jgi:predicted ATPase
VREQPGVAVVEALARVLASQQLLLVLDNCEHVISAAAQLCAGLLAALIRRRVRTQACLSCGCPVAYRDRVLG